MPLYDYCCLQGHVSEGRAGYGDNTPVKCPACGDIAFRQHVYAILPFTETGVKVGRLNDVPLDERRVKVSRFKEAAAELDYAYNKVEGEVGHELDRPNYFRQGLNKAKAVAAGKSPPPKERF